MSNPNPDDEVVEAVARAICRANAEGVLDWSANVDRYVDKHWDLWLQEAQAAIAALPPPTSAALSGGGWRPDREEMARIIDPTTWQVMDDYLDATKRKWVRLHAGYDPEAFKDRRSLAKADAILALSPAQPPNAPSIGDGENT